MQAEVHSWSHGPFKQVNAQMLTHASRPGVNADVGGINRYLLEQICDPVQTAHFEAFTGTSGQSSLLFSLLMLTFRPEFLPALLAAA